MKAIKLLTIMSAFILSAQAQANIFKVTAQDRTEVLLDETHFKGDQTVRIKRQINNLLSAQGHTAKDFRLVGISLRAKSRKGHGQATLIIGRDSETRDVKMGRSPLGGFLGNLGKDIAWHDKGGKTFNRIEWNLSGQPGMANERWQLRLQGNIKVDFMEVHLESALEKVRIRLGDDIYGTSPRAIDSTIRIKQALKSMGYRARNFKLRALRLVGKSRKGNGSAQLIAGGINHGSQTLKVAKPGYSFRDTDVESYRRVKWTNLNASAQQGPWQLRLNGANRVKAVVVVLEAI